MFSPYAGGICLQKKEPSRSRGVSTVTSQYFVCTAVTTIARTTVSTIKVGIF